MIKNKMGKTGNGYVECATFVIPSTPIFGLEEVDPFPVPKSPSSTQESPSTNIPLRGR